MAMSKAWTQYVCCLLGASLDEEVRLNYWTDSMKIWCTECPACLSSVVTQHIEELDKRNRVLVIFQDDEPIREDEQTRPHAAHQYSFIPAVLLQRRCSLPRRQKQRNQVHKHEELQNNGVESRLYAKPRVNE